MFALEVKFLEKLLVSLWLRHRKNRPFQSECESFQREVGIELGTLCGPEELKQFASYFGREVGYYIVVIDADRGRQAYRYGQGTSEDKVLGLLYHANHYDVIRSFKGLFKVITTVFAA